MKRNIPLKAKTGFKPRTSPLGKNATIAKSKLGNTENTLSPYKKRLKKAKSALPTWIKAIPESKSHGTGTLQQRLWKITSDYVRIRDWYKYNGKCVATGKYIASWQDGNAGHFISYSVCHNMFKFATANIHLQSAMSNKLGSASDGARFGEELKRRYGETILAELDGANQYFMKVKIDNAQIEHEIARIIDLFKELEEQPDYVKRARSLKLSTSNLD